MEPMSTSNSRTVPSCFVTLRSCRLSLRCVARSSSRSGRSSRSRREATRARCNASTLPCSTPSSSQANATSRSRNESIGVCEPATKTGNCNSHVNTVQHATAAAIRQDRPRAIRSSTISSRRHSGTRLPELLPQSETDAHGLDAQPHEKQQIIRGQELLHFCRDGIRQCIALKTIALDASPEHVQEAADVVGLPIEDGVSGGRLTMSHEEHRISGQFARRLFEVDQPPIVKTVSEKAVHVAVDQVADEHAWSTAGLESPQTVIRRLAR